MRASGGGNNRGGLQPLLPTHSLPIPTPTPSPRPGGAHAGRGQTAPRSGRAGWHGTVRAPNLGAPSQQRRLSLQSLYNGDPATILLHPPKPPLRGSLSDPLGSEPRTFCHRALLNHVVLNSAQSSSHSTGRPSSPGRPARHHRNPNAVGFSCQSCWRSH